MSITRAATSLSPAMTYLPAQPSNENRAAETSPDRTTKIGPVSRSQTSP